SPASRALRLRPPRRPSQVTECYKVLVARRSGARSSRSSGRGAGALRALGGRRLGGRALLRRGGGVGERELEAGDRLPHVPRGLLRQKRDERLERLDREPRLPEVAR